jgi:hypothetical protein
VKKMSGNRSRVESDKRIGSDRVAKIPLGCVGRSVRRAQGRLVC